MSRRQLYFGIQRNERYYVLPNSYIIFVYSIYYIRNNNFIMSNHEQVGTTSRQKQKFTHVAGLKSFACVADDEELSFGQKVGRLQLFDITYRKKDGSLMTTEAAEIMLTAIHVFEESGSS
ncbi:uncharacterized protein LOC108489474 [Gossypium arboreum]|uniref:uncharacterized protein LOC108489474 n=1 Tax=Gossypium arboreum TaxID=29729 RepID=UPI0022F1D0C9|nr:uncharacterized protein LOC108489474 [Gossypium arboreum]